MAFRKLQHRDDALMYQKLLTIAIPTYGRAEYLEICLSHITQQLCCYESLVEIIVSDNCSPDNTREVAQLYFNKDIDFKYIRNNENLGADRNFAQCFSLATGKYVLVFGDDDILLDGALAKIIAVLQNGDFGMVYLNSYGYHNNYLDEAPKVRNNDVIYYTDNELFLRKINYWITFASGNICNRSLLPHNFDPAKYCGTNLVQLYWYLSVLLLSKQNVYIGDYLVAAKAENTGGYNICKVFGTNLNMIMNDVLVDIKYKTVIHHINDLLLRQFLPGFILAIRNRKSKYVFEDLILFDELKIIFRSYINFWLYLVPVIKLPLPFASMWYFITRILNKLLIQLFIRS